MERISYNDELSLEIEKAKTSVFADAQTGKALTTEQAIKELEGILRKRVQILSQTKFQ